MKSHTGRAARRAMLLGAGVVACLGAAGCFSDGPLINPGPSDPAMYANLLSPSDTGFLTGRWVGESEGTFIEEQWSPIAGDHMMGMFRWCGPYGKASLFEILTIRREGEQVVLRLRHFSAELEPWASEVGVAAERLVLDRARSAGRSEAGAEAQPAFLGEGRAVFVAESGSSGKLASVTYQVRQRQLTITIEFVEGAGRAPLVLKLERAA